MKKSVFILVAVLVSSFVIKAQNTDTIFNDYFLPDFIDVENCGLVEFNSVEDTWLFLARGHHYFITTAYLRKIGFKERLYFAYEILNNEKEFTFGCLSSAC